MRLGAKKSYVWRYFDKLGKTQVQCLKCKKVLKHSGNTSNLQQHLKRIHRILSSSAPEVTSNIEETVEKDCYFVPISENSEVINAENDDKDVKYLETREAISKEETAVWSQAETLALINIYSLHKDDFNQLTNKKNQWSLISKELSAIGIDKAPKKCEIKWRNLLRSYRNYKSKCQGKFDFINEMDSILTNDPHFSPSLDFTSKDNLPSAEDENNIRHLSNSISTIHPPVEKTECCCTKKQKRHEDRMALLKKKVEIEERKVEAFEEYLKYLKSNSRIS